MSVIVFASTFTATSNAQDLGDHACHRVDLHHSSEASADLFVGYSHSNANLARKLGASETYDRIPVQNTKHLQVKTSNTSADVEVIAYG